MYGPSVSYIPVAGRSAAGAVLTFRPIEPMIPAPSVLAARSGLGLVLLVIPHDDALTAYWVEQGSTGSTPCQRLAISPGQIGNFRVSYQSRATDSGYSLLAPVTARQP